MKNVTIAIRLVRTSNPKLVKITATLAMLVFPPLCIVLGFDARTTGVMLGGTIHDVAQVVGAGYAVSEPVGNTAVIVKLFRVFLLLPVVLGVGWYFTGKGIRHGEARVPVPGIAIVFLLLCVLNSAAPLAPSERVDPGVLSLVIPLHPGSSGGAKHSHRVLHTVATAQVEAPGRRGPGWSKRQQRGATQLNRVARLAVDVQSEIDAGELVRQAHRRLDLAVDVHVDVDGADTVVVAVLKRSESEPATVGLEAKSDRRGSLYGECTCQHHP